MQESTAIWFTDILSAYGMTKGETTLMPNGITKRRCACEFYNDVQLPEVAGVFLIR
jgi:hypothetical protein